MKRGLEAEGGEGGAEQGAKAVSKPGAGPGDGQRPAPKKLKLSLGGAAGLATRGGKPPEGQPPGGGRGSPGPPADPGPRPPQNAVPNGVPGATVDRPRKLIVRKGGAQSAVGKTSPLHGGAPMAVSEASTSPSKVEGQQGDVGAAERGNGVKAPPIRIVMSASGTKGRPAKPPSVDGASEPSSPPPAPLPPRPSIPLKLKLSKQAAPAPAPAPAPASAPAPAPATAVSAEDLETQTAAKSSSGAAAPASEGENGDKPAGEVAPAKVEGEAEEPAEVKPKVKARRAGREREKGPIIGNNAGKQAIYTGLG
jgi:hypothetical protein